MRNLLLGLVLAASATASGATTVIFKPGVFGPPAGYTLVDNFDTSTGQALVTGTNFTFPTGSTAGQYVAPTGDTTPYLAILGGGNASITFGTGVKSFSFDYSTVDTYNNIQIRYADGGIQNYTGTFVLGSLPTGVTSGSFIVNGDGRAIGGLTLSTSANSFEVDNLATSGSLGTVPEPASWAMMIVGLGLVGASSRSRRRTVAA